MADYEQRTPPNDPAMMDAAKRQPNGWVYDIDWTYPDTQRVPPEAIRGGWQVGPDGRLTGTFAPNPRYRAIECSRRELKAYVHAAARTNRDQWIVEIDPRGEDRFPNVPEEMIRGWWYVDASGMISDHFRPNSRWTDDAERIDHDDGHPRRHDQEPVEKAYASMPSGASTSRLNAAMNAAPSAPSIARWSKLPVALIMVATTSWSPST